MPKKCLFLKNAQAEKSNFFAFQLHFHQHQTHNTWNYATDAAEKALDSNAKSVYTSMEIYTVELQWLEH